MFVESSSLVVGFNAALIIMIALKQEEGNITAILLQVMVQIYVSQDFLCERQSKWSIVSLFHRSYPDPWSCSKFIMIDCILPNPKVLVHNWQSRWSGEICLYNSPRHLTGQANLTDIYIVASISSAIMWRNNTIMLFSITFSVGQLSKVTERVKLHCFWPSGMMKVIADMPTVDDWFTVELATATSSRKVHTSSKALSKYTNHWQSNWGKIDFSGRWRGSKNLDRRRYGYGSIYISNYVTYK